MLDFMMLDFLKILYNFHFFSWFFIVNLFIIYYDLKTCVFLIQNRYKKQRGLFLKQEDNDVNHTLRLFKTLFDIQVVPITLRRNSKNFDPFVSLLTMYNGHSKSDVQNNISNLTHADLICTYTFNGKLNHFLII